MISAMSIIVPVHIGKEYREKDPRPFPSQMQRLKHGGQRTLAARRKQGNLNLELMV